MGRLILHGVADGPQPVDAPPHHPITWAGMTAVASVLDAGQDFTAPEEAMKIARQHNALLIAYGNVGDVLPVRLGSFFSGERALLGHLDAVQPDLCPCTGRAARNRGIRPSPGCGRDACSLKSDPAPCGRVRVSTGQERNAQGPEGAISGPSGMCRPPREGGSADCATRARTARRFRRAPARSGASGSKIRHGALAVGSWPPGNGGQKSRSDHAPYRSLPALQFCP